MSQVNVEDGRLRVDGLWVDNPASPRKAVDQFIECCAAFGKYLGGFPGIIEMRQREVSCEGAVKRRERVEVRLNAREYFAGSNETTERCGGWRPIGCAC